MPFLYRNTLLHFEIVHRPQDGESLADRVNSNVLKGLVIQMNENFARDSMLCALDRFNSRRTWERSHSE